VAQQRARPKRSKKVVEAEGIAHIKATFNNTLITITDTKGNVVTWATAGKAGFKGSKKSTPFAATVAGEQAGREAHSMGVKRGDRGRAESRPSRRSPPRGSSSSRFKTSRRCRTMGAGRLRSAASEEIEDYVTLYRPRLQALSP
jgi:small subunit ribosomal protein S11